MWMRLPIKSRKPSLFAVLLVAAAIILSVLPPAALQAAPTEKSGASGQSFGVTMGTAHAPTLQQEPVYALPGTLREARNQPFATYLIANDGSIYGLVGETAEVEREISAHRNLGPDVEVKIWGTLFPNGRLSTSP